MIVSVCGAKSQTTDTICFPLEAIRGVLTAAKQKKVQDTLIELQRQDIADLNQQIHYLKAKDSTSREIMKSYQGIVTTMQDQRKLLEREVNKWKRKTRWTAISGVVLTGLVTFLLITK